MHFLRKYFFSRNQFPVFTSKKFFKQKIISVLLSNSNRHHFHFILIYSFASWICSLLLPFNSSILFCLVLTILLRKVFFQIIISVMLSNSNRHFFILQFCPHVRLGVNATKQVWFCCFQLSRLNLQLL